VAATPPPSPPEHAFASASLIVPRERRFFAHYTLAIDFHVLCWLVDGESVMLSCLSECRFLYFSRCECIGVRGGIVAQSRAGVSVLICVLCVL
jgi:hypothetical protein